MRCWPALVLAGLVAGCAVFQSRPLEPARVEQTFRARSLDDPGLRAYIARHLGRARSRAPDLAELTLIAFYFHPDLDVARARVGLAEAAIISAGARPNPSIAVLPELATDAIASGSPWTVGVTIDVPIETAGKRGYRVARAERLTEAARLELGEVAWQVRRRVRLAFADHVFATLERGALGAEAHARADLVAITERRLALGDATSTEVEAARAALAAARLAHQAAEGRTVDSLGAVAVALGLPVAALEGLEITWPAATRLPDEDILAPAAIRRDGLVNRLDVRRSLAEYAAAEAALQLEIARQYPDIHLGPGYKFDQGDNKFSLGLGLTLPVFDRNEGPIAQAEARRRELGARFLALQASVIGEIERTAARYRTVLPEVREAEAALAALEARERATERAVAAGEEDRPTLVAARIQRTAAARARLDALRKAHGALGALEDALQRPLPPGPALPELPTSSPRGER